ncbi:MAG: hypothetical protein ACLP9L_10150 [Thermoguttaceae bacterium]
MSTNWRQGLVEIESVVALLATCAGGILPPLLLGLFALAEGIGVMLAPGNGKLPFCIILVSLAVVTAANAIWVIGMARAALDESCPRLTEMLAETGRRVRRPKAPFAPSTPLPLVMALRLPSIAWLLRPLVGLWWGGHFLGIAAFGILVHDAFNEMLKHAPAYQRLFIPVSLHEALLFASNVYLLLAVAVFFRDPTAHAKLWSWRFIIDLALGLAAWWLAMHG